MKLKKIMAVGLAATMAVSSSVVAFAEDSTSATVEGDGKLEGTVATDVFNVVLPTTSAETLKFILDPEGLIKATNNGAYSGATFADGTLFFQTATNNYTNTSSVLTITNKSAVDVDVKLTAKIKDNEGITLSSDKTFAEDTSASMYMAVNDGSTDTAITDEGITIEKTINKAPAGAYEYKYSGGSYSYELKDDVSQITFAKADFTLTGASNSKGDWSALAAAAPKVEVAYDVSKHVDNAAPTFTASTSEVGVINYTKGAGDNGLASISKIEIQHTNGLFDGYNAFGEYWTAATDTGSKITFADGFMSFYSDAATYEATITYTTNGGETKTATVNVKCQ